MERNLSKFIAINPLGRKSVLTVLIILSNLFLSAAADHFPIKKLKNISVTSVGVTDGEMVFNLKYDNTNEDKLSIILTDQQGMVLYKEFVEIKNINKTFKTSAEVGTIILTVTNFKDKTKQKFEISNAKRYVEEVTITNLP